MTKCLQAVFENGILRPLEPLDLHENQQVTVTVCDSAPIPEDLIDTDFLRECAEQADDSISIEEVRAALAKIPGSMAEVIINERDDRV